MDKKILMVDDDTDLINIYKPVLEKEGYTIRTAFNSIDGLQAYKEFLPDVVFVDLSMEHFDSGFVLCHRIKKLPESKKSKIIIMTSAGHETGIRFSTDTTEETNWIKADDYLEKPVSPRDLVQYVNEKLFKNN